MIPHDLDRGGSIGAPAGLRPSPRDRGSARSPQAVSAIRPVPTGAANDEIRTPCGDACRKRDRIQAVRDRFYRQWQSLVADMQAEIDRINREGAR